MAYRFGHVKVTPKTRWKAQEWYAAIALANADRIEAEQARTQAIAARGSMALAEAQDTKPAEQVA